MAAGRSLAASGVMSHTGHLNFSGRLDDERMVLTARGSLEGLADGAVAVVGLDGTVEHGQLEPSTHEIVGMHAVAYRARPDAGAVLHTHSPHLLAFALAHRPLPCRYEPLLRHGQPTEVPVVPWAPRGSAASVAEISAALEANRTTRAVLLANHGVLAFAPSPSAVVKLVIALEEAAAGEVRAAAVGGARDLPPRAFEDVRASMSRAAQ